MKKIAWFMVHPKVTLVLNVISIIYLYILIKLIVTNKADGYDVFCLFLLLAGQLIYWVVCFKRVTRRKDEQ
jgi:hypothetical protein